MPTDYSKGKIYKITSPHTDLVYIGSTCSPFLSHRLRGHVQHFKMWKEGKRGFVSSFIILDIGDHTIELLETYPCTCSDELRAREQHWIREHGERVCNRRRALLTDEARKMRDAEYDIKYRAINADKIKAKKLEHYQANADRIRAVARDYYQANADRIKAKKLEEYHANVDRFRAAKAEQYHCVCGTTLTKGSQSRHNKTQKHLDYLAKQEPAAEVVV